MNDLTWPRSIEDMIAQCRWSLEKDDVTHCGIEGSGTSKDD